jgi:hypothetical protein
MNYLQLCQDTARESGTISGDTTPSTVTGQSGRLLKVVNWVSKAWTAVQNLHDDWLWMRAEFTGTIGMGSTRFTAASFNLARWSRWITDDCSMTLYKTSLGVVDEGVITFIAWQAWRTRYGRGLQVPNRPKEYSISPMGELCVGPVPDAPYTIRGEYQKSAQVLVANTDVPELPDTALHTVITWKALLLLAQFDEGQWPTGVAQVRLMDDLMSMKKYRPTVSIDFAGGSSIA